MLLLLAGCFTAQPTTGSPPVLFSGCQLRYGCLVTNSAKCWWVIGCLSLMNGVSLRTLAQQDWGCQVVGVMLTNARCPCSLAVSSRVNLKCVNDCFHHREKGSSHRNWSQNAIEPSYRCWFLVNPQIPRLLFPYRDVADVGRLSLTKLSC